jgi:hypothetical protein
MCADTASVVKNVGKGGNVNNKKKSTEVKVVNVVCRSDEGPTRASEGLCRLCADTASGRVARGKVVGAQGAPCLIGAMGDSAQKAVSCHSVLAGC